MNTRKTVEILDCTIRDGSYLIDYQFTGEDTHVIASALADAGVRRIEVGHGLGLDAGKLKGRAAESDLRYVEAARDAVAGKATIGVFFIPGIGTLETMKRAADAGLGFVRVGTNIHEYEQAQEAIGYARELGLEVWSNLMKSYVVGPDEFGQICRTVEGYGADIVVLVDSAGGMTPKQVRAYAREALDRVSVPVGFHGHNNLTLAAANCLAFVEEGGANVDASLRGMGRSAGNAATEVIAALLEREGYDIGRVDSRRLMTLAEHLIAPGMPRDNGLRPVEIATGIAYFHSSFQRFVDAAAADAGVDPFEVILELPESARKSLDAGEAGVAAGKAKAAGTYGPIEGVPADTWVKTQTCSTLEELKVSLRVLSAKTGFPKVMSLSRNRHAIVGELRIAPLRTGGRFCIAHVESTGPGIDTKIVDYLAAEADFWMVDHRVYAPGGSFDAIDCVVYDDDRLLVAALVDFLNLKYRDSSVYLAEPGGRIADLAGRSITQSRRPPFDVGIGFTPERRFSSDDVRLIRDGGTLVVVTPDAVEAEALEHARGRGIEVWRLDLGEALVADVSRLYETRSRLIRHAGRRTLGGRTIVAGGVVGAPGDLVTNSVTVPTSIIGTADGKGGVVSLDASDAPARALLTQWITSSR